GRALRDGGMMVDLPDCGQALVRMVVARQYDLILLDLALPDLDGAELLETLRSDHPDIQVMVVSAHDDSARRVRCLDGGAIDFVGKPFDLSELLARVRAHLRPRQETSQAEYVRNGQATLDVLRREVILP